MKKLVILLPLLLTACATTPNLIATENKVVVAPEELYYCPSVTKYPDPKTLTDRQVGILLLKYHRNNKICKDNLDKVKEFYSNAQKTIEADQEKPKTLLDYLK